MSKCIETVTFKLNAGSDLSAFIDANGKVNAWAREQPGFLTRDLSQLEDDTWLDVVYWATMSDAKRAGETFMSALGDSAFMSMIDPASVKMSHGELRVAIQSE
ncbi:hypothetical protein GCM10011352_26570 [Marinobacterium zhoushanense]|uniref:ABM domain-containing protein n=1 Tax=Marinobacterium zhoushanense TaxID=1679163 RepID=A0ABQ1KGM6_9GAMM|nr:hypothetical protein [Marinobacterium zhoushanense]GGB99089.1 hypothetical protein GCM10011352_26570 [Marinobacterium zhoushanense]